MEPTWRAARPADDGAVISMCLALYREDPGPTMVEPSQVRHTLETLRAEPHRGRAVVLAAGESPARGYALLISFWSNERGGEVCEVDELYVEPEERNRGYGSSLFEAIAQGRLWSPRPAAIELSITAGNARAKRLYVRLGFMEGGLALFRPLGPASTA